MFGYVTVNKPEMKVKDYERYRSFYCGLCSRLKRQYGRVAQSTLTFDMTFLAILLTSLYEPKSRKGMERCIVHPIKQHQVMDNEVLAYCADMNVLLAYHNLMDDWIDQRKVDRFLLAQALKPQYEKVEANYERQAKAVKRYIKQLHSCEKRKERDLDKAAGYTGTMLGEIFVWKEDVWAQYVRKLGFYLGKYIYLLDAFEDQEQDKTKHLYNPWLLQKEDNRTKEYCHMVLRSIMIEATKAFEFLPCIQYVDILRNTLYSGIWCQYMRVIQREKRKEDER